MTLEKAWQDWCDDNCPHLNSATFEQLAGNSEYEAFCKRFYRKRGSSGGVSTKAKDARSIAKQYGMLALTGNSSKAKSYGEHIRREVIARVPENDRIGLRCLTRSKDYIEKKNDIEYFISFAAENAEVEREKMDALERSRLSEKRIRASMSSGARRVKRVIDRYLEHSGGFGPSCAGGDFSHFDQLSYMSDDEIWSFCVEYKDTLAMAQGTVVHAGRRALRIKYGYDENIR